MLKLGVTELAPLTFRALTLPFAALGMLLVAKWSGDSIRVPRAWWGRVAILAFFNIAGWNGFVLFGVQQLPAGRSAIIAYTMPIWATLIAMAVLHEPLNRRKIVGLVLGLLGMVVLLGDDIRHIRSTPIGALLILCAAILWACGTVLLRKWKPPMAQNALSGWMMLLGWLPLVIAAPFFDPHPPSYLAHLSGVTWFALLYNIFLAGTRRPLGVVHAGADVAGRRVVAVVAAGAGGRSVLGNAVSRRAAGSDGVHRARACACVAVRRVVSACRKDGAASLGDGPFALTRRRALRLARLADRESPVTLDSLGSL